MKTFTFPKPEHLCLRRDIDSLFASGARSTAAYPLRAVYRRLTDEETAGIPATAPRVKVLLSVPKRKLRHAVDRNRAKRQLREAYRLQKHLLLSQLPQGVALHIGFLWLSAAPVPTELVARKVKALLLRIGEDLRHP